MWRAGLGLLLLSSIIFSVPARAVNSTATIQFVLMDNRACAFFTLDGVTQADPIAPGSPWFAIPKTASNYSELFSLLASSKYTGKAITATTDGTLSCGFANTLGVTVN